MKAALILSLLAFSAVATAQPRRLVFEKPEAIEKLKRAEALHHAPTILGRLGECQVNVGEVVEGTENLNLVVREPLAETAPKARFSAALGLMTWLPISPAAQTWCTVTLFCASTLTSAT